MTTTIFKRNPYIVFMDFASLAFFISDKFSGVKLILES